jgi:hypothetical protein
MFKMFTSASMRATRLDIIEAGLRIQQRDFLVKRPSFGGRRNQNFQRLLSSWSGRFFWGQGIPSRPICNQAMVAGEGSAPPTSGCRPDVILFHHRAKRREKEECRMKKRKCGAARPNRTSYFFILPSSVKSGCRGWNRTSIRAFKGRCPTIRRPGRRKRQKQECRM